jgi:hypothetical protein
MGFLPMKSWIYDNKNKDLIIHDAGRRIQDADAPPPRDRKPIAVAIVIPMPMPN